MKIYHLIKTNPPTLHEGFALKSLPPRIQRPEEMTIEEVNAGLPEGYKYVPELARPELDQSTHKLVRATLTLEGYGWKKVTLTPEEIAANTPEDIGVTPQTIIERMVALGKWATFKALLEDETRIPDYIPAIFYSAQRIRKTNPMFVAFGGLFKTELGLTDEAFDEILTTDEI